MRCLERRGKWVRMGLVVRTNIDVVLSNIDDEHVMERRAMHCRGVVARDAFSVEHASVRK